MAQAINEAKLREWMEKLGPRLITISTGICRDRHQAEEIVQEAFIKLWRSPPDAGEVAYTSWMRRVVTNLSINALKRTKRPGALPEFSQDPAMHSGDRPEAQRRVRERVDLVREALERLDPAKRTILVLRAVQGLSYDEIAEHLGVPIGTVMSRLNRARLALAEEMGAIERENEETGEAPAAYPFQEYRRA
ncbi:MAG: RNA polymerase sigma factor [Planctomycetes bacterium]|nr:RNA polymerase sigma factor [Planctomycetota bacterium]